jgi:hypothetical protein
VNDAAERDLMTAIQKQFGPLLDSAEKASGISAAFFAALIANETGGKPDATRFEPAVFTALSEVLLGRKANYGSIGAQDLAAWVDPGAGPAGLQTTVAVTVLKKLADLATSWGLTQIMGYEAIAYRTSIDDLRTPLSSMTRTAIMLKDFAKRNNLDVAQNFTELFDCWNTGRPHAPTADPTYIPDGLARMALYQSLESAA